MERWVVCLVTRSKRERERNSITVNNRCLLAKHKPNPIIPFFHFTFTLSTTSHLHSHHTPFNLHSLTPGASSTSSNHAFFFPQILLPSSSPSHNLLPHLCMPLPLRFLLPFPQTPFGPSLPQPHPHIGSSPLGPQPHHPPQPSAS